MYYRPVKARVKARDSVQGVCLDDYKAGDVIRFRRHSRFEVNHSEFLRPSFLSDDTIAFIVGVHTPEWLEAEMNRRVYRPMIATRFDPARLP